MADRSEGPLRKKCAKYSPLRKKIALSIIWREAAQSAISPQIFDPVLDPVLDQVPHQVLDQVLDFLVFSQPLTQNPRNKTNAMCFVMVLVGSSFGGQPANSACLWEPRQRSPRRPGGVPVNMTY